MHRLCPHRWTSRGHYSCFSEGDKPCTETNPVPVSSWLATWKVDIPQFTIPRFFLTPSTKNKWKWKVLLPPDLVYTISTCQVHYSVRDIPLFIPTLPACRFWTAVDYVWLLLQLDMGNSEFLPLSRSIPGQVQLWLVFAPIHFCL